ncbi:MAG: hypothetical protein WCI51_09980 [Lentisphaerota bacterium]
MFLDGKWKAILTMPLPAASPAGAHKDSGISDRARTLIAVNADETGM